MIVLFTFGYFLHLKGLYFPLSLDIVFGAMLFLSIAHIFKSDLLTLIQILHKKYLYAVLVECSLVGITWCAMAQNPNAVMAQNKLYDLFFYFVSSFGGILAVVLLFSVFLVKYTKNKIFRVFQYISRNGIVVLATHVYCIFIVDAIAKIARINNLYLIFFLKILVLSLVVYFIIVPFINSKFYFFVGKKKLSFQQSLVIN